jgi:hypothetical protein
MASEYITELRELIHRLHGVRATHVESVLVKEVFQGQTVWDGIVEVFELHGHPKAARVYAWSHGADGAKKRHVTVLHVAPITSAVEAVRAAIVQEFRSRGTATEES